MTIKKIIEFIRAKFFSYMEKNTSVEEHYTVAANRIIDEITKLRTAHVKSVGEENRLINLANEKEKLAIHKERDIRRLLKEGVDVTTHAKLGLLYRRTADALREKASKYSEMRSQIEETVVKLDDQRLDLAVKLEYIRETRNASVLGITNADDVIEVANLAKVDVDHIIMKVDTFNGVQPGVETTTTDIIDYIESLSK